MKLQKLYAIILGLALIAPQANLQATKVPASQGNFSWVGSALGTLASFGTKTLTFPFTTLSFCYRNLFAGAVLAGVAYWGYKKYAQPLWNTYQNEVSARAQNCYKRIDELCSDFQKIKTMTEQEREQEAQKIQTTLNECSWTETYHSTRWLPWTHGGSAIHFFNTLKQGNQFIPTTQVAEKKSWVEKVAKKACNIYAILANKYSGITPDLIQQAYGKVTGDGCLGMQVLYNDGLPQTRLAHSVKVTPATA